MLRDEITRRIIGLRMHVQVKKSETNFNLKVKFQNKQHCVMAFLIDNRNRLPNEFRY
jgi:hypothetical protein